ncbi:MAG: hypothetical protein ACRDF9_11260 [Candidatus Limnocylindria bacterium]
MYRTRAFLVIVLTLAVLATGCLPLARVPSISPTPEISSPSPSVIPSLLTPSPSPTASPASGIQVTTLTTLPADPRYFSVGGPDNTRILLFDSSATRPPIEVVRFDPAPVPGGPDVRAIGFGASADGRVLVIAQRFSEQRTVHYLVRPQTGEVLVLLTDLAPSFSVPVVSPDGARYAYARLGDAASTGVFVAGARAGPDPKRIVASDPQIVGSPPQPVAWSSDGAWLAVTTSNDSGSRIGVVQVQAGETTLDVGRSEFSRGNARMLGPGHSIDWRGGDQNLLVTSSRNAFGGRSFVYATSLTGAQPRELYAPTGDAILSGSLWHPALDRFVVHQRPLAGGPDVPSTVWVRKTDGTGTKVLDDPFIGVPWWSKDGTRLWAPSGGDDSVAYLRDLLSTTAIMFCLRSASPPCV